MNFLDELRWRGMLQDYTPGAEKLLTEKQISAYVGIDPTADSLHIGHLVSVMILKHFQLFGHKPILVVGGATGMIGDPSGKSKERNLLNEEALRKNQEGIKKQLQQFLNFSDENTSSAEIVNNYDWMKDFSFLSFIRDIGKHMTVNYMIAKDSVKKRMSADAKTGISFTEFSYQLVQATDFWYLYRTKNCRLQFGGSDQWGNITSGIELIRRKEGGEAQGVTCPLITKSDGKKFGKTESGNIWLDKEKTSPYKFYQFWLNVSDTDAEKYIKIFTLLKKDEIETLVAEHQTVPERRLLQKRLAEEVTVMVHSKEDLTSAQEASAILFGKQSSEILAKIDEKTFLDIFEGVPRFSLSKSQLATPLNIVDMIADTGIEKSKGELRRLIKGNGISLNKEKITSPDQTVSNRDLIRDKYLLVQKGKKSYFLIIAE
ncbi:MAG: tyrosine--tRNA ligase [Bacteroidales bacterium]|nr:tyrosine--tRNA ligase [Bacteroidales bacterium]